MNVEVKWYDDRKTAVLLTIHAFLAQWPEFDAAADQALELARSVSNAVIVIIDPQGFAMPKQGTPLPHLRRALVRLPANVTCVVGIMNGLGFFERSIVDILANISFRKRFRGHLIMSYEKEVRKETAWDQPEGAKRFKK